MKKLVLAAVLAVSAMAITQQQASAWVNSRFSLGLNWGYQSGGNNFLWGAWKNGQPPGPEAFGAGHIPSFAPMPQHAPHGYAPVMPQAAPNQTTYQYSVPYQYGSPYQFANYPRPVYYYPAPTYYYYYGQ
ncbi:MAG: hypothetical protein EXR98_14405 [Gemmataceae bacterium]|nr:hypothetical protein [Gemmataceae bacterium]